MNTKDTVTENGMIAHTTTSDSVLDFFGKAGSLRLAENNEIIGSFLKAFHDDSDLALKALFWARDVRGGAGERKVFRTIVKHFTKQNNVVLASIRRNLHLVPEYGRWDDLLVFIDTRLERDALNIIKDALLVDKNGLCAKWMPRPVSSKKVKKVTYYDNPFEDEDDEVKAEKINHNQLLKRRQANKLRAFLKLTPKNYRKLLSTLSNTVESLMCDKDFKLIDYSKVPSLAFSRYQNAFRTHDEVGFNNFLSSVEKGETKINTGAIFPYDVTKNIGSSNSKSVDLQWASLPDFLEGNDENILPLVDVSASMNQAATNSLSCMDVAISLGLYLSERVNGKFKDYFMTFSETPQVQLLKGSLTERYVSLKRSSWGYSTNLEKVFTTLLTKAKSLNLPQEEMPTKIIILSDMQFNLAINDSRTTSLEMISKNYEEAGYKRPDIIYWNLRGNSGNLPVKAQDTGTALVSGFSPSILKNVLAGVKTIDENGVEVLKTKITPFEIMINTLTSERYESIIS